jgi:hypothetical protein
MSFSTDGKFFMVTYMLIFDLFVRVLTKKFELQNATLSKVGRPGRSLCYAVLPVLLYGLDSEF